MGYLFKWPTFHLNIASHCPNKSKIITNIISVIVSFNPNTVVNIYEMLLCLCFAVGGVQIDYRITFCPSTYLRLVLFVWEVDQ